MNNKKSLRTVILGLGIPLLLAIILYTFYSGRQTDIPDYAEVLSYMEVDNEAFEDVESYHLSLERELLTITFTEESKRDKIVYRVPDVELFVYDMQRRQEKLEELIE